MAARDVPIPSGVRHLSRVPDLRIQRVTTCWNQASRDGREANHRDGLVTLNVGFGIEDGLICSFV